MHALTLQQTTPVTAPAAAYNLPSYEDFLKSLNGGLGGGHAGVEQFVPVTGGHQYALRLHYRAQDMALEKKAPGPERGYTALSVWVYWQGAPGAVWVLNEQGNTTEWRTLLDGRVNYYAVAKPYVAPPGATGAVLAIGLTANAAGHLPKVTVDDVELVDVDG